MTEWTLLSWIHTWPTANFVSKARNKNTVSYKNVYLSQFNVVCTVHHIAMCRWTNKMHRLLQIIFISLLLLALHVSDEIHVHHQEHCLVNCITQYSWLWTSPTDVFETFGVHNCLTISSLCIFWQDCFEVILIAWILCSLILKTVHII